MTNPTVQHLAQMAQSSSNGVDWYTGDGPRQLNRIAATHGVSYQTATGAYCALSPNIGYVTCYRATQGLLLQRHKETHEISGVPGYTYNLVKAWFIANGGSTAGGPGGPQGPGILSGPQR